MRKNLFKLTQSILEKYKIKETKEKENKKKEKQGINKKIEKK